MTITVTTGVAVAVSQPSLRAVTVLPATTLPVVVAAGLRGPDGAQGPAGASFTVTGAVAYADLPATASPSALYIVTDSGDGYTAGDGYIYDADLGWTNVGAIRGPQGPPGDGDMQSLIYDPTGVRDNCFNLANLSGNLDAGTF